jgi:hypothetical protein
MKESCMMSKPDPHNIRRIFLSPRPNVPLMTAADLLGMTLQELKRDIADGTIVAVSTAMGTKVTKEELIATAMRLWDQSAIEEASATTLHACCRRPSASSSCAPASPATSATSSANWPAATTLPSTPS